MTATMFASLFRHLTMQSVSPLPIKRPALHLLGTEPLRALSEFIAHKWHGPQVMPQGDGHPVLIFPGLGTDGTAVAPLRDHCESLGYTALDWGRGFNTGPSGDLDTWMADLAADTQRKLAAFDQPATLIGWSLGGFYARELAKIITPQVRQVISIGTPFNAFEDHTHVGWVFRLLNGAAPKFDPLQARQLRRPPPVPTTSIYSRSDGVVAWQTCLHDRAHAKRQVQDIEISGSHIGMGWNREVMAVIADRLLQPDGRWQRYRSAA